MNKIRVCLDEGAICPTRAHEWDAGLDLYAPEDVTIEPLQFLGYKRRDLHGVGFVDEPIFGGIPTKIDTGVHVEIPKGYYGHIESKSGLMLKGIDCTGTIDCGYTGSISAIMKNTSGKPFEVKRGQKITQLVISKCACPEVEIVETLEDTERGDGGFGSTGK